MATLADSRGQPVLAGLDAGAAAAGLSPGLPLAAARARLPELEAVPAAPWGEAAALAALADWARRFTPWSATDGADGLLLDVTGCAHLFGGEAALVRRVQQGLARLGYTARAGLAPNAAAAWGWARFGGTSAILDAEATPQALRRALGPLPVAALRLPESTIAELAALGLRTVGDLAALPRAALAVRLPARVADRLARLLGEADSPIAPRRPPPDRHTRLAFVEPIAQPEAIDGAVAQLVDGLCALLDQAGEGASRLTLRAFRVDGRPQALRVGTSRPTRDPAHLRRLLHQRRSELAPGLGIEVVQLEADAVAPAGSDQLALPETEAAAAGGEDLASLIDRLGNRLGRAAVLRVVGRASFVPENAQQVVAPLATGAAPAGEEPPARAPRPVRLLPRPEPVTALAPLPDSPPARFRWRGTSYRLRRADGPERILAPWWDPERAGQPPRDYYRVEADSGRRFWLFRAGHYDAAEAEPQWYVHGIFG